MDLSVLAMSFVGTLMLLGSVAAVKKKRGGGKRGAAGKNRRPGANKLGRAMRVVGSKKKKKLDDYIDDRLDQI